MTGTSFCKDVHDYYVHAWWTSPASRHQGIRKATGMHWDVETDIVVRIHLHKVHAN